MWLSFTGSGVGRFVKLDGIRRLAGSPVALRSEKQAALDFADDPRFTLEQFIAEFLTDVLEKSGYRSFDDTLRSAMPRQDEQPAPG